MQLALSHRLWAFLALPFFWACSGRPVKTVGNLRHVAASERNAMLRYRSCSARAREEGLVNVANLFSALACSEEIHVQHHIELLSKYGETVTIDQLPIDSMFRAETTVKNLRGSLRRETYESMTAFPIFEKTAATEGADEAEQFFRWLATVATRHGEYCRRDGSECGQFVVGLSAMRRDVRDGGAAGELRGVRNAGQCVSLVSIALLGRWACTQIRRK